MDLDQVLFGLDSFVSGCERGDLELDSIYTETYITLLDQLAVHLRDESTRDDPLITQNLQKFVHAADYVLVRCQQENYRPITLEIIRVLANAVADKPMNRDTVCKETAFIKHLAAQIQENFDDDETNERILILLKNLVIDSPDVAKEIARHVTDTLLVHLSYESTFLSVDLLTDLLPHREFTAEIKNIERFTRKFMYFINNQSDFDEDEFAELLQNTATILEQLTLDPRLSFKDEYHETTTQHSFFQCFHLLAPLEFQNKLTVQRKIFAASGNVSANPTSSNKTSLDQCIQTLQDPSEENGYIIASAMTIIGNSIASAADRNEILDRDPSIVVEVLEKYNDLVDPVQFQGLLHILKNLVSFDTITDFFTDHNLTILAQVIEATVRNSKYYTNFNTLLVAFLKKLVVLLGKAQLQKLLQTDIVSTLLTSDPNYDTNLVILLLINKVAVYGTDTDLDPLMTRVLEFKNPNIPASYVFELTKTVGVLMQNKPDHLLTHYSEGLKTLLDSTKSITLGPNAGDNAAKAIENNTRYIAGAVINISKEKPGLVDDELLLLCKGLFRN